MIRFFVFAAAGAAFLMLSPAGAQVLATSDSEEGDKKVEITDLKRSGDAVTLRFRMINQSSKAVDFGYTYGESTLTTDYGSVGGIHLIDQKNRKKYLVMRDEKNACVCSRGLKTIEPEKSAMLWARFPAPPEGTEKVTVVIPKFLPIDDVPIAK
jgi:hypothetical protein